MIMNKQEYKMSPIAYFWYYAVNIMTFGSLYFIKIAVKKALTEDK